MGEHPIENLMNTAMNSIKDMIDVDTIIGDPIQASNNTVIIPISKVGFGFAAGGSEFRGETLDEYTKRDKEEQVQYRLPFGGGAGAGVSIIPMAFLVVQPDTVKLLPVDHSSCLDRLLDYVPEAIDKLNTIFNKQMQNRKEEKIEARKLEEKKIEEEELGVFIQYPIRLAWAITIHKSQGLTFSRVVIDFTGGVFAGGQAYVALSRCTSLNGIQLKKQITRGDIFVRPEIVKFSQRFNNRQSIEKALKQAQADVQYVEAVQHFDKGDFERFLEQFFLAIHSRYDIEKPLIKRFIRKKLGIINNLKVENKRLKDQFHVQRKNLEKYAREYYLMGNECIIQAHDSHAAIANYDKAIELNPSYTDAWVRKGITLHNDKEYYEAEVCLNEAVRLSPALFKAIYNRGKNRLALDNIEGALGDFDRAVSLKPEHPKAHEYFGDVLMKVGKEEEAALQWAIAERLREKNSKN